jgi:hypothetical protein
MTYFKIFKQPFYEEDDGVNISINNSENAEPNASDEEVIKNGTDDAVKESDQEVIETKKQSNEDNAKYAAARREAEKKAKEIEQRAAKLERDYSVAKKYGQEYGVFSEEDIRTNHNMSLEEFETALQEQKYKDAGLDPDLINQVISNHPAVKQATEYTQQLEEQKRQAAIKQDIENLHKEFPGAFENIKQENDIYSDPKFSEIHQYLERGYDLADAFYKVYKNDISIKTTQSTIKSTIANIQDKARRSVVSSDGGQEVVPELSVEGKEMANAFGVSAKAVAQYVKNKLKK